MRIDSVSLMRRCVALTLLGLTCSAILGAAPRAVLAEEKAKPAGQFQFSAWTFDRGNGWTIYNPEIYADYRDKYPELVVSHDGQSPWTIEYDINFPVDTTYTLNLQYSSPGGRPVDVWIDDKKVATWDGRATGNPPPYPDRHPVHARPRYKDDLHGLEWLEACKLPCTAGKHTLKFTCQTTPPHISALRLESPVAFPKEWKLNGRTVNLDRMHARCRRLFLPPGAVNVASLRLAIVDMTAEFGDRYPKGAEYLKRLTTLETEFAAAEAAVKDEAAKKAAQPKEDKKADAPPEPTAAEVALKKSQERLHTLQREAMLTHPSLDFDKLLFLKRHYVGASIYTEHEADTAGGGNICLLSPVSADGKVTELVPELSGGRFGRFDLSFDATKILFSYTKPGGQYRIYEIDIDPKTGLRVPGKPVRQLTFSNETEAKTMQLYEGSFCGKGYDDMDPCYTPSGTIMFVSTRAHRTVLCRAVTATTLHLMDADGKNIRCISGGQVNELAPGLLDDGRIVYPRWEYVDKGFANAVSLWAVRPDGSGSEHIYKNTVVRPCALIDTKSIPGGTKLITVGAGHHGGLDGPLILVDNRVNRRDSKGMTNLTPEISYPGMYPTRGKGGCGKYRYPFPFSEKFFLVSHNTPWKDKGKRFGIHAFDAWGNRAELYADPALSCYQPVPLRPRHKPTEILSVARRQSTKWGETEDDVTNHATLFLQDVYQGLQGVPRGKIKYIRVMEAQILSWKQAHGGEGGPGMQMSVVSIGADPAIKKIHGIVKVHQDGSAHFKVPTETNVFFQALDENFMEVQRMRTFLNLVPGEKKSCIGCHEVRRQSPRLTNANPMALDHEVQMLQPQPGDTGPRTVHYEADVQPTFDKHCVGCHSGETPKGDLDLTGELTAQFNRSYENLCKKHLVSYLEGGYGSANLPAEPPMTFGSYQSKLVDRIRQDPCKSNLTREEFIKIVTWIDSNVAYYGTHHGRKNKAHKGESNFRPLPLAGK